MACECGIAIRGEDARYAEQAADAAFAELPRIEAELSKFDPASDVSRINGLTPGRWLTVGPDTAACLAVAARAFRRSAGAFDPAYRSSAAPRAARGFRRVVVDPSRPRVRVTAPVRLDLGAVGKGHAVDRMAKVLKEWGIRSALVHAGTSSALALGGPWPVALRHPVHAGRSVGRIALTNVALGGSAQSLNGPHVLDPGSGRPATRAAAWAVAESAALADALSTAALILPVAGVRLMCRRVPGLSVMIAAGGGKRMTCRRFGARSALAPGTGGATR